jgi:hypothetical protein
MALSIADRVLETTTTTGTGTINLGGAKSGGYQTFVAGIGSTNTCHYCIVDAANNAWEVGLGTVTDATPDTLSRDTILDSSNAGAAVNFAAGTKDVFCVLPAMVSGTDQIQLSGDLDVNGQDISIPGASGNNAIIRKNQTTSRDELQIYAGGDAFSTGSRGAGIHLYGNSDLDHDGNFAVLTGPNELGDGRMIVSGWDTDTHVTIGNDIWDYVDAHDDKALLTLINPRSAPGLLIYDASGTEGDIATLDGQFIQMGHWSGTTYTNRFTIKDTGLLTVDTVDYETLVSADDDIPNRKWVTDQAYLQAADLTGYLQNIVEDTTPELGADLSVAGFRIESASQTSYLDLSDAAAVLNGAGNLAMNAAGNSGIVQMNGGTSATGTGGIAKVQGGQGTAATGGEVQIKGGVGGTTGGAASIEGGSGGTTHGSVRLTSNTNKVEVDPTNVIIGDTTSDAIGAEVGSVTISTGNSGVSSFFSGVDDLIIENNAGAGLTIVTPDIDAGAIAFGSPTGTAGDGYISWSYGSAGATQQLGIGALSPAGKIVFFSGGSNSRMKIDDTGRIITGDILSDALGVDAGSVTISTGNSTATTASTDADDLIIESATNTGITIFSPNSGSGQINFGDQFQSDTGSISYSHSLNSMTLKANVTNLLRLDGGNNNVLIGNTFGDIDPGVGGLVISTGDSGATTASVDADDFIIESAGNTGMTIFSANTGFGQFKFGDPDDANAGAINYSHTPDVMTLKAAATNLLRLDGGNNNVLIGNTFGDVLPGNGGLVISTGDSGVTAAATNADDLVIEHATSNGGMSILAPNTLASNINFGDPDNTAIGKINYAHSTDRMQFTAGGQASLQILSDGSLNVSSVTNYENLVTADDDIPNKKYVDDAVAVPVAARKNLIINGDFRVAQRGTSITTNGYTLDRWKFWAQGGGTFTVTQESATGDFPFVNYFAAQVGTADASPAATDYATLGYIIEGADVQHLHLGKSSAKTITISFWHRHTVTGTYSVSIRNSAFNRSYVATYTQTSTNTWEQSSVTIPLDTTGTWLKDVGEAGLNITFTAMSGSTYTGTADTWTASNLLAATGQVNDFATTGNWFRFANIQAEVGSQETDFEDRPYAHEFALCQRYYQTGLLFADFGDVTTGLNHYIQHMHPVVMCGTPTAVWTNTNAVRFGTTTTTNILNNQYVMAYRLSTSSGGGARWGASYTFDAEL